MGRHRKQFLEYVHQFKGDPRYDLKTAHTFRVAHNCASIAKEAGLEEDLVRACVLAGLYHDAGRFEQLRQYGTFLDAKSLDHGALSRTLTQEKGWLDGEKHKEAILEAISLHSRLTETDNPILQVLQDADKADILHVFGTEPVYDVTGHSEEEARNSRITPEVYAAISAGKLVRKDQRKAPIDIWLTYLAFLNNTHFSQTKGLMLADASWQRRFAGDFADERIKELFHDLCDQ